MGWWARSRRFLSGRPQRKRAERPSPVLRQRRRWGAIAVLGTARMRHTGRTGRTARPGCGARRLADAARIVGEADGALPADAFIDSSTSSGVDGGWRKVVRRSQRQEMTSVLVNEHPAVRRQDFDRLRAILHNCVRHAPSTQNRDGATDFRAHLAGRIAHVSQIDAKKGARLRRLFDEINWHR